METQTADSIRRRAVQALHGDRPEGDEPGGRIPVDRYLDRERFASELRLFKRHPQPLAASAELPEPGSLLAAERLGVPVLLVRQDDGHVAAFVNVCRHRGARVVANGQGEQAANFVCPYHAWTYTRDGSLKSVPGEFGFPCLDKAASGLRPLAVGERAGMVWVIVDPDCADHDINAEGGAFIPELESLDLKDPAPFATRSYEVAANWKLLLDGSLEAYHFKLAHRKTIAPMFRDNLQIIDEAGNNRRLFLLKTSFDPDDPPAPDASALRQHGNLLYFFFPNTIFLVQPDHTQFSTLEPLAADRTRVHEITLLPDAPESTKAQSYWQANVAIYRQALSEDYALAESIQGGLASDANEALTFGTFEFSVPRFHRQLDQALSQ